MTSWMAERDRLLAQANSLAKGVDTARSTAAAHAQKSPQDRLLQPRPATATPQAAPPSASRTRSVTEGEADHQPLTFRRNLRSDAQPSDTIAIPMLATSERDDIEIRVTRFREQQTKLAMQRQAYCEETVRLMKSRLKSGQED